MAVHVYNTLARKKEPFEPLDPPKVGMYVCGLTVYDYAHIGHARTAVAFEVIRRWLEFRGYDVLFVQNVTDVDDKIINRAAELGRDPLEHAALWTKICAGDMAALGLPAADVEPRVTRHMVQIIRLIETLVENKAAYVAPDGSVYYDVSSKADYGKLSNRSPADLKSGARVAPAEGKRDPKDFALWKASKEGEPSWTSPWGEGRPGWHIECSAMSMTYLGSTLDIHGGGQDLVFPHHENEVAQSESATGQPFSRYWLHSGFLTVNGEKMSKSLNNFITIEDILKEHDPEVVRFFYAHTHYRSQVDYNVEAVEDARRGLERLRRLRDALTRAASTGDNDKGLAQAVTDLATSFGAAMDDDFNTRDAVAGLFSFLTACNKALEAGAGGAPAQAALDALNDHARVLTIFDSAAAKGASTDLAEPLINLLLEARESARAAKQFEVSDRIRDRLEELGVEVSDGKDGPTWRHVG